MLVLSRRAKQKITGTVSQEDLRKLLKEMESRGDDSLRFVIEVVRIEGKVVRLGLDFPAEIRLLRDDVSEDKPKDRAE